MLKNKTLFVVGAGASAEVGLPLGSELTEMIQNKLSVKWDENYMIYNFRNRKIQELASYRAQMTSSNLSFMHETCLRICQAMPATGSIDDFLNANKGDENLNFFAKLAIILIILDREKNSALSSVYTEKNNQVNIKNLKDTWYMKFWKLLIQNGCEKNELPDRLKMMSLISFNYDRCIERFLILAMRAYYNIPEDEALGLLSHLEIIHPYGKVGNLFKGENFTAYGDGNCMRDQLFQLVKNINTYSEGVEELNIKEKIQQVVLASQTVVFLGFGYHAQNLKLLNFNNNPEKKYIYGSTKGLSLSNQHVIENELENIFRAKIVRNNGVMREPIATVSLLDETCTDLFDEYSLSFINRDF